MDHGFSKSNYSYGWLGCIFFIPSSGETEFFSLDLNMSLYLIIIIEISVILLVFFFIRGKLKNKLLHNKYINSIFQLYFKYINSISQVFFNNKFIKYIATTRFYKASIEANNIPLMNPKVEMFHKTLLVRGFRVLGGIFFLVLFGNYIHIISLPPYLSFILFIWVISFLSYTMFILLHTIYYIIKAFFKGDIIYKNSPVSVPLTL